MWGHCAFSAYHSVKGNVRAGSYRQSDIDNQTPLFLRESWSVFAQTFCSEAVMLGLQTNAFSLPSFLDYLTNGGDNPPISECTDNYLQQTNSST